MCAIKERTLNKEENKKQEYLNSYFRESIDGELTEEELAIIGVCENYVSSRFSRMKYILGTALDFTLLAQLLSESDPDINDFRPTFSQADLFSRYTLVQSRGKRKANTLSLSFNSGKDIGIRKLEESVLEFFHSVDRTDYPSAYVYNTGQWQKYQDLLSDCFKLSELGRFTLCSRLIDYGLTKLAKNTYYTRTQKRVRLFEEIINDFERGVSGENGGLIFQSIAFGYCSSDFAHLSIVADKVRTGSSRQKRFGDIDCYFGLDLELSIEVKDFLITESNYNTQLSGIISNMEDNDVIGVAFVKEIEERAYDKLNSLGVATLTEGDLLYIISFWDWQKQNNAVQGMLHYLAHIEQDPKAVNRLLEFINALDPEYDSLEFSTT